MKKRTKAKNRIVSSVLVLAVFLQVFFLSACVDQHQKKANNDKGSDARLIATSFATAQLCDKMDMDLVGVCDTYQNLPERYEDLPKVGMAMGPDLEKIKELKADYVMGPNTLEEGLSPKYESINQKAIFLNMKSVDGLYESATILGDKFGKKETASQLNKEYKEYKRNLTDKYKGKKKPKVLILMGFPNSYVVATDTSYVGSLAKQLGAENVYKDQKLDFVVANTEDMNSKDADIILRCAHVFPDDVAKMFQEEFKINDIWKHFKAVKENKVYDLDPDLFGMSAKFNYPEAYKQLGEMLYGRK